MAQLAEEEEKVYEHPSTKQQAMFKNLNAKYIKKDSQENHYALWEFMQ